MNLEHSVFNKYFNPKYEKQVLFSLGLLSSLMVLIVFFLLDEKPLIETQVESTMNLSVMIPEGHILYPFEVENYEGVDSLLDTYSMVKVYSSIDGSLLAKNIKTLRAPKDPSKLAFLIPFEVADFFARQGQVYRIVVQKYDPNKKAKIVRKKPLTQSKKQKTSVTFGSLKDETKDN